MLGWSNERKPSRYLDPDDLYDQLDSLRSYVGDLAHSLGKSTSRGAVQAKKYALDTVDETEDLMKDHLAASMLLAVGVGVLVGYFLRRGTE